MNLNAPSSFTGYSIASSFVLHLMVRPRPKEWIVAAIIGLALNQGSRLLAVSMHLPVRAPWFSLASLGAGSLLVLAFLSVRTHNVDRQDVLKVYLPAIVLVALVLLSQLMLAVTTLRDSPVLDAHLQTFDLSLAWPLPFSLGRAFLQLHGARYAVQVCYSMLPMIVAVVCGAYIRFCNLAPWPLLKIMAIAGAFGYVGYLIFPAVGPAYIKDFSFPALPFTLADIPPWNPRPLFAPATIARNAMPSLHMAWALLLCINARGLPRSVRVLTQIYLVLTVIVVLGLGEHYIADLVVAIPFSVAVQAIASPAHISPRVRSFSALGGFLLVALWLLLLRFAIPFFLITPFVPWVCVILTIVLSAMLLRILQENRTVSPVIGRAHEHSSSASLPGI
jgi:hypothetical protein